MRSVGPCELMESHLSENERRVLFVFIFIEDAWKVSALLGELQSLFDFEMDLEGVDKICRSFAVRGMLTSEGDESCVHARVYRRNCRMGLPELRELAVVAEGKVRWGSGNAIEVLRGIVTGSATKEAEYEEPDLWRGVLRFAMLLPENPDMRGFHVDASLARFVYPYLGMVWFLQGWNASGILRAWGGYLEGSPNPCPQVHAIGYASLCVLTGFQHKLKQLDVSRMDEYARRFVTGCIALGEGDLNRAWPLISSVVNRMHCEKEDTFFHPAATVIALALATLCHKDRIYCTIFLNGLTDPDIEWMPVMPECVRWFFDLRKAVLNPFKRLLTDRLDDSIFAPLRSKCPNFISRIAFPVMAAGFGASPKAMERDSERMIRAAQESEERGYVSIAGLFLDVYGPAFAPMDLIEIADMWQRLKKGNCVHFGQGETWV